MAYDTLCRPTGRRRLPKADLHISPPHNKGYPTGMAFTNCSLAYFAASPRIARGRTWRLPFAYFLISSPVRTIAGTSAGVYHLLTCISRRQSGHLQVKCWRLPFAYLHISPPVRTFAGQALASTNCLFAYFAASPDFSKSGRRRGFGF